MAGLFVAGLITVVGVIGIWMKGKFNSIKTDLGA
jgi:hypothetical protein